VVSEYIRLGPGTGPVYLRDIMLKLLTKENTMSTDVATVTNTSEIDLSRLPKPVEVDIDHMAARFQRLVQGRKDLAELKAFVEAEEAAITAELAKRGGTDARINGVVVLTHRPIRNFRYKEFTEEYPDLVKQYMRPKTGLELDKEALAKDHPALLARFRSTSLLFK
jgi:hypothetical protein